MLSGLLADRMLIFFAWLVIVVWFSYLGWLLISTLMAFRNLSTALRVIASILWSMILAGFALFFYKNQWQDVFEALIAFLIGLGTAGLAYMLSEHRPMLERKLLGFISVSIVLGAALMSIFRSAAIPFALFGFVGASLLFSFLSSLLLLTFLYIPKASTLRRSLLFAFWLVIALGVFTGIMILIFPGVAGLVFALPSASPIIKSQKTGRLLGVIPSYLMLIAAVIISATFGSSLFQVSERFGFIACVTLITFGILGLVASYLRIKILLLLIGLLTFAAGTIISMGSPVAWPLPPIAVLFLLSGLSVQPNQTSALAP